MFLVTEEEVCLPWNMFCGIKSAVLKIKMLTIWKDRHEKTCLSVYKILRK